jgi:imidazolonepropionase-like amidohydrolase
LRGGSTSNLAEWLRAGVTTIRDLGSEYGTDELPSHDIVALKKRLAEAGNTIPTVVVAGPILTAPDGYPIPSGGRRIALEVPSVEEARQAATRLLASGADGLKIAVQRGTALRRLPTLTSEQVAAITQAAHARHTWVSAHIIDPEDAARAVANGVDDLAHAPVIKMPDELIRQMVARDVLLIPTLVAEGGFRANLSYTDRERAVALDATRYNLQRFLAAGGKVALGSDFGSGRMRLGMPLLELQSMVNVGMTPMQVIAAATRYAAQACGLQDRLGTLEAGKRADVIVVKGDPLKDIQAMKDVMIVIKGGEVIVQP